MTKSDVKTAGGKEKLSKESDATPVELSISSSNDSGAVFLDPENAYQSMKTKEYFPSGASSRSRARDYTLLVPESINAIVDRHQFGIESGHARGNWQRGMNDPAFIRDRMNHFFEHAIAMVTGVHPKDGRSASFADVEAALCNLQMIAWYRTHGTGLAEAFPHLKEETDGSKPTQA